MCATRDSTGCGAIGAPVTSRQATEPNAWSKARAAACSARLPLVALNRAAPAAGASSSGDRPPSPVGAATAYPLSIISSRGSTQ